MYYFLCLCMLHRGVITIIITLNLTMGQMTSRGGGGRYPRANIRSRCRRRRRCCECQSWQYRRILRDCRLIQVVVIGARYLDRRPELTCHIICLLGFTVVPRCSSLAYMQPSAAVAASFIRAPQLQFRAAASFSIWFLALCRDREIISRAANAATVSFPVLWPSMPLKVSASMPVYPLDATPIARVLLWTCVCLPQVSALSKRVNE